MKIEYPNVWSHPPEDGVSEVPLEAHLRAVGERARAVVPDDATTSGGEDLGDVAELLGRLHDFGKLTSFFQAYIRDETPEGPTHHARLGAFVTYYVLDELGVSKSTRIAGTVAVWKHHGRLPNAAQDFADHLASEESTLFANVCEQVADIEQNQSDFAEKMLSDATGERVSWAEFVERAGDVDQSVEDIRDAIESETTFRGMIRPEETTAETYADMLQLSSALVLADKTRAAGIGDERLAPELPKLRDLKDRLDELGGDEDRDTEKQLNRLRDAAQDEVEQNVRTFLDSDESVATITLPTGYGKTLVGLRAALELQERRDTAGRLVYALPFTSIIDQTAETLREIFDADPTGRALTVHHHLTETVTLPEGDDEGDADRDGLEEPTDQNAREDVLVGESWRSGMTLTTFVQLFESLAGPANAQSMKLPSLYGSVVVVDEPQALPLHWWPLVKRLVELLTEVYDARVILMTATQPELVDDPFPLIQDRETYFDGPIPDRVEYAFDSTAMASDDEAVLDYDEAARRLVDATAGGTESSLAVCNTIDSARELSESVEERVGEDDLTDVGRLYEQALGNSFGGLPTSEDRNGETVPTQARARFVKRVVDECDGLALLHLTTRIRPCDRRALLRIAADLSRLDVPLVVVSTQLIEAGVDISFDRVYRDFASLDSIVQAAGRCNRSYDCDRGLGSVTVWRLGPTEGREKPPSEAVYARTEKTHDQNLLRPTRDALEAEVAPRVDGGLCETAISESLLTVHAVKEYHRLLGEGVVPDGNDLIEYYEHAKAKSLGKESLIDQKLSFEVYVCRTEAEHDRVEELWAARDNWEFDEIERIQSDLAELRVSVPVYRPDSEAARQLTRIRPLSSRGGETNWDDETERVLDREISRSDFEQYFDVRDGVHLPESGVEGRFL